MGNSAQAGERGCSEVCRNHSSDEPFLFFLFCFFFFSGGFGDDEDDSQLGVRGPVSSATTQANEA